MTSRLFRTAPLAAAALLAIGSHAVLASSHREAPFIGTVGKVDATDFYMFNSYETGRGDFVTLIANYQPLQDAYGGPNYFKMDANALYEIHVDNAGDGKEDLTFQFRFQNTLANGGNGIALPIGSATVAIPLTQAGQVVNAGDATLNVAETYTLTVVRGDRRSGVASPVALSSDPSRTTFIKPSDNIGVKTIPNYAGYAAQHIYTVNIPGCAIPAKMFVGQRKDPFAVNLGTIFDLVNAPVSVITNPANIGAAGPGDLVDKNVTSLALEVAKSCLTTSTDPVIGGWTSSSLNQSRLLNASPQPGFQTSEKVGGSWVQVSRLGNPLVNEVVIGLRDKDRFNASLPVNDVANFATYVTNPTLPRLLEIALDRDPAFGGTAAGKIAPTNLPRTDLLNVYLTGLAGVNKPRGVNGVVTPAEMLRLNTAIAAVPLVQQNRLGVAGEVIRVGGAGNLANATDLAGFPNGRRPNDDIVDISLVAVAGGLCVLNSEAQINMITASSNANVLGLNNFTIPGTSPTTLSSECRFARVPLGATSAALHDAVDQAKAPLMNVFPYLMTPLGGTRQDASAKN